MFPWLKHGCEWALPALHAVCAADAGETIPASDSEEEAPGNMVLDGIYRQQQDHILRGTLQEFGKTPKVLRLLAEKLDATVGGCRGLIFCRALAVLKPCHWDSRHARQKKLQDETAR